MQFSPSRWLAPLLVAACGVAGYQLGRAGASERISATDNNEISQSKQKFSRELRQEESPLGDFKGLILDRKNEISIWKVVSRLPATDIPEALRSLREARSVTASWTTAEKRLAEIESALYYCWAESDPVAALANVSAMPGPPDRKSNTMRVELLKGVLSAWMKTDPNAAYRAVKDVYEFSHVGRDLLVKTWTADNVFENLKLFPDKHKDLFGWYCVAAAQDEDQRNAMLKALKEQPDLQDHDWGYEMLFKEWVVLDIPAAMAEAKKLDRPGFEKSVLEIALNQQPAVAIRWAVSQDIPPDNQAWTFAYDRWLDINMTEAEKWLEEQAPAWETGDHFQAVADFRIQQLSRFEKIDLNVYQPVWIDLMTKWRAKDPDAAEKWLNGSVGRSQGISSILEGKGYRGDQ